MSKDNKLTLVKQQLAKTPNMKSETVAKHLGVSTAYAYNLMSTARKALGMRKLPDGTWGLKARMQDAAEANRLALAKAEGEKKQNWKTVYVTTSGQSILAGGPTEAELNGKDNVNHPAHYKVGGIETIDFIEAKSLGYNLGNVVKYITRADHKGSLIEDLKKARWYLNREISKLDGAEN